MKVYICPMCNATLTKIGDKRKGKCEDCVSKHWLKRCYTADRDPEPNCIEKVAP